MASSNNGKKLLHIDFDYKLINFVACAGMVTCPRTKEMFAFKDAEKVYVM